MVIGCIGGLGGRVCGPAGLCEWNGVSGGMYGPVGGGAIAGVAWVGLRSRRRGGIEMREGEPTLPPPPPPPARIESNGNSEVDAQLDNASFAPPHRPNMPPPPPTREENGGEVEP